MNTFLKQKASSRKAVLSKFLQLDVFEKLHDAAKRARRDVASFDMTAWCSHLVVFASIAGVKAASKTRILELRRLTMPCM